MIIKVVGFGLLIACVGCATVQSTFSSARPDYATLPEETMREIALEIETAVAQGNRDAEIADRGGIVVSTPEMRQSIRTRAARHALIDEFRAMGFGLEKEDGLITIMRSGDYKQARNRQQKNRDAGLIISENNDRWALYEGIREESNLPRRSLGAIRAIFAEARVSLMAPGQEYKGPDGERRVTGN